jgi:RNA polymerase sigma factor (sigma-70 family)
VEGLNSRRGRARLLGRHRDISKKMDARSRQEKLYPKRTRMGDGIMPQASPREAPRYLKTLFQSGAVGQLSDQQLLGQFISGRGDSAEAAFAVLVERHGTLVLGVCRRVLGNREAAEDAFQATFLVLARKASTVAQRNHLDRWLYGVALRAALDARARANRQKAREKRVGASPSVEPPDQTVANELRAILDEELAQLPERYRSALLLCELEGLSRREAASRLGVSEGTLSSRLARAKEKLKDRLIRRGLALSSATLSFFLTQETGAMIVPPALIDHTIRAAATAAAGASLTGVVSTSVVTLAAGVLKTMLIAKLKGIILGVAALVLMTCGVTAMAQFGGRVEQGASDDRLKAVERKLDKLLDAFGASAGAPAAMVDPADAAPRSGYSAGPPPPPLPPRTAPSAAPLAVPTSGYQVDQKGRGTITRVPIDLAPTIPASGSLEGRIGSLEKRLEALERRLDELERDRFRLNPRSSSSEAPSAAPGGSPPGALKP